MKQEKYQFEFTKDFEKSAEIISALIHKLDPGIKSFMDFGCGMGVFSGAFEKLGIDDFIMIDHPLTPKDQLFVENKNNFIACDLDKILPPIKQIDLVICMEVLEHFENKRSLELLDFLCACSELVLFSAAIPRQWGNGHINEQFHSFWHEQFAARGYSFYDGFKGELIRNNDVLYCYAQNVFVYYKNSKSHLFNGSVNYTNEKYNLIASHILERPIGILELIKKIPKALNVSLSAWFSK